MDLLDIICNVILSVCFAASFICIFFFTYAKDVERQVVLDNLKYIINSLLSTPIEILKNYSLYDTNKLSQLKPTEDDLKEDEKVIESNNKLLITSFTFIGILLLIGLLTVFGLIMYKHRNEEMEVGMKHFGILILKNLFMTTGIGITEFIFLNTIGANFKAADGNVIIKQILINLNNAIHKVN